jgi:hypothetical protein
MILRMEARISSIDGSRAALDVCAMANPLSCIATLSAKDRESMD